MTVQTRGFHFEGLSTDPKPSEGVPLGCLLVEIDTGHRFRWDGALWQPADPPSDPLVTIQDIDQLLRTLLNTPLVRLAIDAAGRMRVIIDVAGTATPVTQSGTWNMTQTGTWILSAGGVFPVDQRWELIQRANIEFAECQRNRMAFA